MPRHRDVSRACRVYTVCDESRYLIVRNVPALGCGDELAKLFATYGDVEECKPMDAEDCEEFTDVYWIKFRLFSNARFAKRKLDEFVFLGNQLKVSYANHFESLEDTKTKLETRRKEILGRLNPQKSRVRQVHGAGTSTDAALFASPEQIGSVSHLTNTNHSYAGEQERDTHVNSVHVERVSSDKDYFTSLSMNQTVNLVREKLNKIEEGPGGKKIQPHVEIQQAGTTPKRQRIDNRRRI